MDPYVKTGPAVRTQAIRIAGVEYGQCDFTYSLLLENSHDPETTGRSNRYEFLVMLRGLFDQYRKYITQANAFFSTGFLNYYIGNVLTSSNTQDFICSQDLAQKCSGIVPG